MLVKCWMFIRGAYPFLAASPDGLLGEDSVVEVKCPFRAKNKPISRTTVSWLIAKGDHLTVSTDHKYYYQVQGQLYCIQRERDLILIPISEHLSLYVYLS